MKKLGKLEEKTQKLREGNNKQIEKTIKSCKTE